MLGRDLWMTKMIAGITEISFKLPKWRVDILFGKGFQNNNVVGNILKCFYKID